MCNKAVPCGAPLPATRLPFAIASEACTCTLQATKQQDAAQGWREGDKKVEGKSDIIPMWKETWVS